MYFTIITATYNAAATLPRLLDSLAGQSCRDFELIIQDGGSNDDTVAVAESYRDRLPVLSLAGEPDSGIYDAWNKALQRARGEWVLFLGADDTLVSSDTLGQCEVLLANVSKEVLYAGGSVDMIMPDDTICRTVCYNPAVAVKNEWRAMPFPHQALWHRRTLFEKNSFDASLRIVGDYDFICRTWCSVNGSTILPLTVTRMRRGGISDTPSSVLRLRWENALVSARYFRGVWTASCCLSIVKGFIVWLFCLLLKQRAAAVLDWLRVLRGLPPAWSDKGKNNG